MNEELCSPISTFLAESPDSLGQPNNSEEYEQLNLLKLIPTHSSSSDTTSQEYQSTQISETITPDGDNSTSLPAGFPVQAQVTQESEPDYLTQNQPFGEKELEYYSKLDPDSVLLSNLKELSDEDFELFLADSTWQDTLSRLKQSRRRALELSTKDSDCLSFPTPTSNECSTSRPAGQTKCERWFKDKGLIAPGYQLGRRAIALIMGFPSDWFDPLCQSQPAQREESEPDTSQDEPLHQDKQRSLSEESSTLTVLLGGEKLLEHKERRSSPSQKLVIPCIVKQPKQPEIKGVIQKDLGDRFIIYIPSSDSTVTVSKLFIYPDFSKSVGQSEKSSSKITPPSTNCSSKLSPPSTKKRKQGYGAGYIECKPIKRSGKEYKQYWFHWEIWREGDRLTKKSRYIPKRLLSRVEKMEASKAAVREILEVLGVRE
jgi:hypothetical protein